MVRKTHWLSSRLCLIDTETDTGHDHAMILDQKEIGYRTMIWDVSLYARGCYLYAIVYHAKMQQNVNEQRELLGKTLA